MTDTLMHFRVQNQSFQVAQSFLLYVKRRFKNFQIINKSKKNKRFYSSMIHNLLKIFRFSRRSSVLDLMGVDIWQITHGFGIKTVTSEEITLNKLPITIIGVPSSVESESNSMKYIDNIKSKLDFASKPNTTYCFEIDNTRAMLGEISVQKEFEAIEFQLDNESILNYYLNIDLLKKFQQRCLGDQIPHPFRQEFEKSWNNRFAYQLLLHQPLQKYTPDHERLMLQTIGHVMEKGNVKLIKLPRQHERTLLAQRGLNETKTFFENLLSQLANMNNNLKLLCLAADMNLPRMSLQLGYLLLNINRLAFEQSNRQNLVIVLKNALVGPLKNAILKQNDQIILETDLRQFGNLFMDKVTPEDFIECIVLLDILDDHESWSEDFNGPYAFFKTPISEKQAIEYNELYKTFKQKYRARLNKMGFTY